MDTHQGLDLDLQRRDALGLSTLLIKENQSGPVETLCTVVVVLDSRLQIQGTLQLLVAWLSIRRRVLDMFVNELLLRSAEFDNR